MYVSADNCKRIRSTMANAKKTKRILLSAHEKFWNFNENIGISTINMIEKSKHNISISSTGISSKLGINAKLAKKIAFAGVGKPINE